MFQSRKLGRKEQSFVSQLCPANNRIISSQTEVQIFYVSHSVIIQIKNVDFFFSSMSLVRGKGVPKILKEIWEDSSELTDFAILVRNPIPLHKKE